MSDSGDYVSTSSEDPRELLVSVQLYISAAMEVTFRKVRPTFWGVCIQLSDLEQPIVSRKKSDLKRDTALEDNKFKGLLIPNLKRTINLIPNRDDPFELVIATEGAEWNRPLEISYLHTTGGGRTVSSQCLCRRTIISPIINFRIQIYLISGEYTLSNSLYTSPQSIRYSPSWYFPLLSTRLHWLVLHSVSIQPLNTWGG